MPSTPLLARLTADFPSITFQPSAEFFWSPVQSTVHFNQADPLCDSLLLHELAHGVLGHQEYSRDVELIALETAAWDKAKELAPTYEISIDEDAVQDHLDTYRDWLHARSSCPSCNATGLQGTKQTYRCVACGHEWRANTAQICALRRYTLPKTTKNPA
ncbi:MAG TPA: hypothetical protein QF549_01785 [Candidatus Saccharimonadaceae bacterium]|nr:hypothetical protein [Candidatus Saccharimonadaceae bacterium]